MFISRYMGLAIRESEAASEAAEPPMPRRLFFFFSYFFVRHLASFPFKVSLQSGAKVLATEQGFYRQH